MALQLVGDERLIPAHAGKTCALWATRTTTLAHPRSRGENFCTAAANLVATGSSPLTRGKLEVVADICVVIGLIPAHAGKTGQQ